MARSGRADLAAKERRKKKLAIAGAVVLVLVLAIQVPRTMKMLNRTGGTPAEQVPAAGSQTGSREATSPARTVPSAGESLAESESPSTGQLVSFTRFSRKDPFRPQIREDAGAEAEAAGSSTSRPAAKPKPVRPGKPAGRPAAGAKARLERVPTREDVSRTPTRVATAAVVSVNGVRAEVRIGSALPASGRLFTLASLRPGLAKIRIAGGSLAGGGNTITLKSGKALTLENTASGARYRLRLLSIS